MKKLIFLLALAGIIFILPSVSAAWEWDNCGEYSYETNTMCVYNMFCYGDLLGCATLESPHTVHVGYGEEILVGWYNLTNEQKMNGDDVWGVVELYDRRGNSLGRGYKYKREHPSERIETICEEGNEYWENGTVKLDCTEIEIPITEWQSFNVNNPVDAGFSRIGLFTEVMPNERGEWIPTLYGVPIPQWATWESGLFNLELQTYYDFNKTAGNEPDLWDGDDDITSFVGTVNRGKAGLNESSYSYEWPKAGGANYVEVPTLAGFPDINSTNGTISIWVNWTQQAHVGSFVYSTIWGIYDTGSVNNYMKIYLNDTNTVREIVAEMNIGGTKLWTVATTNDFSDYMRDGKQWIHIALVNNETDILLYVNGTYVTKANNANWTKDVVNNGADVMTFGIDRANGGNINVWNGTIDEFGYWSRPLDADEITNLYNNQSGLIFGAAGAGTFSVSLDKPSNNTITIINRNVFNGTITAGQNINITNATLLVWNSSGDLVNNTLTNIVSGFTIAGNLANSTENFTILNLPLDEYNWSILGCGNNSDEEAVCSIGGNYTLTISRYVVNNQSYSLSTYSGAYETFEIYLNTSSSFTSYFIYNGTNTGFGTATSLGGGEYKVRKSINVDTTFSPIKQTVRWRFDFLGGSYNTSDLNQSIFPLGIDDCSTYWRHLLNFSLYDEDERTKRLNGTIELVVNFYDTTKTINLSAFNQSFYLNNTGALKSARVCTDTNSTLYIDYQAKYYSNETDYSTEYKFAQSITMTNNTATQDISLYDLLDSRSTAFTIILQNPDLSEITGAVVDIQRQYIPINQFISVESPKTNAVGEAIAHLVHNEIYYNFVVTKDGVLLGTFNNYLVQCQNYVTGDCRIYLNLAASQPSLPDWQNWGNISGSYNWTASTRTLYFSFIASDSQIHNVSWNVVKLDSWGNNTICNDEQDSAAGTMSCVIPVIWGNSTVMSTVYSDTVFLGNSYFSFGDTSNDIFGGTRVVLAILMYLTITLLFIAHPLTLVIGSVLGMIFVVLFRLADGGTLFGSSLVILWFVIAGAVIIYNMRNKI